MKKKMLLLCCLILGLTGTTVFAQQGINAAGGNATGTGGSVSYSIGQVFYAAPASTSYNIIQGLQQPYEISVISSVEEKSAFVDLTASVYPNPTIDNFTLKVELNKLKNPSYVLFDARGQMITQQNVTAEETLIEAANINSAYYILKVYEGNSVVKTFKIVKYY